MSLTVGELKKVSVQSIRDISAGLRAKAASMRATKAGISDLPHKGTWTGVAADNADHEIGHFGKGLGSDADAYEDAAKKADRAGDEFEGLKQLLSKLENEASGKFSINEATGEVTPLTKDFNKSDRDYIANTIKQLCAAGGQANDELAAAIHSTDGATTPASASAPGGPLPSMPGSAIKPDGVIGGLQNLAAPNPDGDPGATKAAAAVGGDTQANYKEWYPKNTVPVGDKNIDPSKLGGVGALPGVGNIDKTTPAKLAPTLADRDVPAFKDLTRQNLINSKVPADQIEQRVNDAVKAAQAPRFLPDADPARTPGQVPLHNSPGDQFNDIVGRANDSATKTIDGQIDQAKILTGQAGPGAPGVADAWKDVGLGAAKQVHELMTDPLAAPKMGIEQAKDFYNHPGEFIGKNMIVGTEGLATGAVGGEAAAGVRGLLGDLTGAEGRILAHDIPDTHHAPAPFDHPLPHVEHPTLTGGDHTPASTDVDGPRLDVEGNPLKYLNGNRPDYGPNQLIDVWNLSREEQLVDIHGGKLELPEPGSDQQWVRLHPTGPIGEHWTVDNGHRLIEWREGEPRTGLWDMGHVGGNEYAKLRDQYHDGLITFRDFIDEYRDPENYRVQDPYRNRSHIDEHR